MKRRNCKTTNCHLPTRWLARLGVVLAALAPLGSARASWFIRNWQSDMGLPDNTVIGITQAPDGFLWVATKTGLTRFDGVRFQPWPVTADGAQAGACKALLADRRGRIWVAKDQGVVVCVDQGHRTTVVGTDHAAGDLGKRFMVEDAEGAVWVAYGGGEVLRLQDGRVRSFAVADGLPAGALCHLAVDGMGRLWFSRGDWVGVFRDGKFRPLRELPARFISGCRSGGIWGYKDGQLWKFTEDGTLAKLGALPADTPLVTPTAFHEDRDGFLWLGTREAGLFRFDHAGVPTAAMPQQAIVSLADDREGNLWVGYGGQGLGRLKAGRFSHCRMENGLHDDYLSNILPDGHGRLWFAGNRGIFSVREKELDDFADGRTKRIWWVAYGRNDGLAQLQASSDAWPGLSAARMAACSSRCSPGWPSWMRTTSKRTRSRRQW